MDKQKQIEEMAKEIFERGVALESIDFIHGTEGSDHFERIATALYNAGYRKIPENAVVLTREELDKIVNEKFDFGRLTNKQYYDTYVIPQKRKETAEKFAERVKMAFYYEFDELIPSIMADKIDEILKEITEG